MVTLTFWNDATEGFVTVEAIEVEASDIRPTDFNFATVEANGGWWSLFDSEGEIVAVFEEDEDEEPDDIDSDFGFDPYEGCYTYDC